MIPESIKIDDNGDFSIVNEKLLNGFNFTFEEIEEAYLLAKGKREHKSVKYGCHIDADKGGIYNVCELDYGNCASECTLATYLHEQGKCKTDCQYWRPI